MKKAIAIILGIMMMLAVTLPSAAFSVIKLKTIKLNSSNITLKAGDSFSLKITFNPANTTQKLLTYVVGNKNIATIDKYGKITGVKRGTTEITVTSTANKAISAKCKVTVTQDSWKVDTSPINTTYYTYYGSGQPAKDNNIIQQELAKRTGVNIKIEAELATNQVQKEQLIAASNGDFQDIAMFGFVKDDLDIIEQMGKAGMLWDIKPYLKDYPNLAAIIKDVQSRYEMDGKLYCWPSWVEDSVEVPFTAGGFYWVRKDLFNQLNIQFPKTPDEFTQMLRMAKEKFKGANGKPIIPFVGYTNVNIRLFAGLFYGPAFREWFLASPDRIHPNTNLTAPIFQDKALLTKASKFINTLSKEELLDKEFFTTTTAQGIEKMASGNAFACSYYSYGNISQKVNDVLMATNKDSYFVLAPIPFDKSNPDKVWNGKSPFGYSTNVINKKKVSEAKLKRILAVVDYLSSPEGYALSYYGRLGQECVKDSDGRYKLSPEYLAKTNNGAEKSLDGLTSYSALAYGSSLAAKVDAIPPVLVRQDGKESMQNFYGGLGKSFYEKLTPLRNEFYVTPMDGEQFNKAYSCLEFLNTLTVAVAAAKYDDDISKAVDKCIADCKKAGIEDALKERIDQVKKKYNLK